ncbi:MAG TPA: class I SAM-dependent methyltransferase [Solirubrobacteraceae bacterium]|nr:class I SAM-dependent methyltransferase [Solirubrobacteraceae bacterium]
MVTRPCPACGGRLRFWRSVPASDPALGSRSFELLRCSACGTAVTVDDAVVDLHETGAYGGGSPRLSYAALPVLRRFDARRLSVLGAPVGARLLDVGAGRGRFVLSARAAGYDAFGIEPSARGVSAAALIGAPVEHSSVADASISEGSVDAVTLWHVLEHLDDPGSALLRIRDWLRPGGALLVGMPNLDSWQARIGGSRWYHLDVPRHRVHFTVAGIRALLERSGFEPVRTEHLLLEHNPFGMWQSIVNRFTRTPSYLYNLLKRNAPARSRDALITAAALPLAPAAAALEVVAGLAGRGGTIAVLARRPGAPPAPPASPAAPSSDPPLRPE